MTHHIPEDVVVGVGAHWVVKESSDVLKERWAHVAGAGGISEAILSKVAGDVAEESICIIGQDSGSRVGGGVLLDQSCNHGVEHGDISIQVGLHGTP